MLDQIINDAIESSSDLGDLLRRCTVLASRLGNTPLEDWILWESNGYPADVELPDYRIWFVQLLGNFIGPGNLLMGERPISAHLLPEKWRDTLTRHQCRDSIGLIEQRIRNNTSGSCKGTFHNLPDIVGQNRYKGFFCLDAWYEFSINGYQNVVNTVRNRLLKYALALQKEEPNAGELGSENQIPNDKLTQIFNNCIIGENQMGDSYKAGQAGAMGPKAHAHDMNFNQIWIENSENLDLSRLQEELAQLQSAMKERASEPEHQIAIGNIAAAEQAAEKGDGPMALQYLKNAGTWALDVAKDIGVGIAVAALTASNS